MARLTKFEQGQMERFQLHDGVEAEYFLYELDGRKLFQLNTMGREIRDMPGKVSQSIQLDREGAERLVAILTKHFGL